MEIITVTDGNVEMEDIERAFKDHATRAKEHSRKYYLTIHTLPASECKCNDKYVIFIKKEELQ